MPKVPPQPVRRPLWLTVAVLVTIAGLAALGLVSLRQDRRAAEQDARLLAETLADALARESSAAMAEAIQSYTVQREEFRNGLLRFAYGETGPLPGFQPPTGELLAGLPRARCFIRDPDRFALPDHRAGPETPDWLLDASREVLEQFELGERLAREGDSTAARTAFQAVAGSGLPPLQALAELRLAELDPAEPQAAMTRFRRLGSRFPDARTPGGLAIGDLALVRAIAVSPPEVLGDLIQEVVSRASFHPSFLSERLFTSLEQRARADAPTLKDRVAAARAVWTAEQNARVLLDDWRETRGIRAGLFPVGNDHGSFLLLCAPSGYIETNVTVTGTAPTTNVLFGTSYVVTILPLSVVDTAARQAGAELGPRWPRYLSAEIQLAGLRIGVTPWSPGVTHRWDAQPEFANRWELLASGQLVGTFPFTVSVRLANPDRLYAKHQQRVWLFGGVILLAAGLAGVGAWQLQRHLTAQVQLNEQKSNFVSSVSHELRAPIASVRLLAESLERGKVAEPAKQHEYFRFIGQECRRLSALIENVLDFSRIEQGRKQYEFEPTDLAALVEQTVKLMAPYAAARGVELEPEADCQRDDCHRNEEPTREKQTPNSPDNHSSDNVHNLELNVDGRAIQQALVNLIDNAIKHSPKGGTVVVKLDAVAAVCDRRSELDHDRRSQTAATIALSVSDHGPGIPPSEHEKIFERFYRLGSELRRETQGVGIGLSIVKHIVEAHGGRVRVESEVGKGSRFTIELPLTKN